MMRLIYASATAFRSCVGNSGRSEQAGTAFCWARWMLHYGLSYRHTRSGGRLDVGAAALEMLDSRPHVNPGAGAR